MNLSAADLAIVESVKAIFAPDRAIVEAVKAAQESIDLVAGIALDVVARERLERTRLEPAEFADLPLWAAG